jgi:hypothetical protein
MDLNFPEVSSKELIPGLVDDVVRLIWNGCATSKFCTVGAIDPFHSPAFLK